MFTKLDKKVLSTFVIIIIIILLIGFLVYKYLTEPTSKVQNYVGGAQVEVQ